MSIKIHLKYGCCFTLDRPTQLSIFRFNEFVGELEAFTLTTKFFVTLFQRKETLNHFPTVNKESGIIFVKVLQAHKILAIANAFS